MRGVQIKLEVQGLEPEEMAVFYYAVEERMNEVMEFLGCNFVKKEIGERVGL